MREGKIMAVATLNPITKEEAIRTGNIVMLFPNQVAS